MGRIADALKKAQRERNEQLSLGIGASTLVESGADRSFMDSAAKFTSAGTVNSELRADPIEKQSGFEPTTPTRERPESAIDRSARLLRRSNGPMNPLPAWDVDPQLVAVSDRSSSVVEQYRAVRTWLLSHNTMGEHSCIALTSSSSQEGKTVTTANLAVILSEVRHLNVLAVDADIRRGGLAKLFRMPNGPGLADVLSGRNRLDETIAQTPIPNLSFLPASKSLQLNPAELFNTKAAGLVFDEIRERFHYVLVDTPPVQAFSDVGVVGALCTGILMVVRMHKTPSTLVRQSVQWLQANNLKVIGCVAAATNQKGGRLVYDYDKS